MSGTVEQRFERFGGLNLQDDDIADHEARDLLNVVGKPRGGVRTRDGSSRFAQGQVGSVMPTNGRFMDIFPVGYVRTTGLHSIGGGQINMDARRAIFAVIADVDLTYPPGVWPTNTRAVSIFNDQLIADHGAINLKGGVSGQEGNGRVGVANAPNGLYVLGTGTAVAYRIDPSGDTLLTWTASAGTLPQGNLLKWWAGRMFATAIRNFPARIQASTIGDPSYWSTTLDSNGNRAWTLDLEPGDGDVVVGWGAVDTYLVVFKRRRCWVIYDGDTGANRLLSPKVGAKSRFAVVETPYGVAFQATDHSVWLASGSGVQRISDKVAPLCTAAGSLNAGALGYAANHLYAAVGAGTLDYDFTTQEWRLHSFTPVQLVGIDFDDGGGDKLFALTDPSTAGHNFLRYFDPAVSQDLGTSFDSHWSSGHHTFGSEVAKRIRRLRTEGSGTIDVSFSKERGSETFQRTVAMGSPWGQGNVLTPGVAHSWGFRFGASSGTWSLDAVSVDLHARTK